MKQKKITIPVSTEIGKVSAISLIPAKPVCVLTIAHGAGAGMNHPFMEELATSLTEKGVVTVRFNFPYMEKRKGAPDRPPIAHKTIESVIARVKKMYPDLPLFASGKSFGGRMTSQFFSENPDQAMRGIIFFGFPLHAPGKPSTERGDHLKKVKSPMLFLQGSRDEFAEWKLIKKVTSSLPKAQLVEIKGANHGFKAGKINTMEILVAETLKWVKKVG